MSKEPCTWDEQQLAKLTNKLTQHHAAHQTILLTNYYYTSAVQLGIQAGSAQYQLYRATLSLDRALAIELRARKGAARLAYYRNTVKPLDDELTKLLDQLKHRQLLTKSPALAQAIVDRQLIRIARFKLKVKDLPEVHGNLFLRLLQFIKHLQAWVQGKKLAVAPVPAAIDKFTEANEAVLGVYYGRRT